LDYRNGIGTGSDIASRAVHSNERGAETLMGMESVLYAVINTVLAAIMACAIWQEML
jgi:hypothetical protein